ncbi:MAG: M48 family metallopeptidase [Verrucomicrobia bacterium]|nr:M48 family metallopeptidase [Verrucomicrobiota bacterium]
MGESSIASFAATMLIGAKWATQLWLERLNLKNVLNHAATVPEAFKDVVDGATYAKSIQYTLAKGRLNQIEETYDAVVLLVVLFSGCLPWALEYFHGALGASIWSMAGFVFSTGLVLVLAGLPIAWYAQFRLEQRFGFNTTTPKLWWLDRVKGLLLALALGYPLIALILKTVEWAGPNWWLWAWASVLGFQLLMTVLAPALILPWFNKFSPLAPGSLQDRLHGLAERTGFRVASIQVMDGSKRSRHSNAFFTGFGRFRKIVLFDTLVEQLSEPEVESVLAHEIGHYKKKHLSKMLALSSGGLLLGFYAIAWLARQTWFYGAFGFQAQGLAPALVLFGLLSGVLTFWFSPLANLWTRHYEFQADAYAASAIGTPQTLIGALRKLTGQNLSNLTPHPFYSGFYYSHPTLPEREAALRKRNGLEAV